MSDRWYHSCRGVEHGGHKLTTPESRFFWRVRHHIRCAEPNCDLEIIEPGIRHRRIRIGARLELKHPTLYYWSTTPFGVMLVRVFAIFALIYLVGGQLVAVIHL